MSAELVADLEKGLPKTYSIGDTLHEREVESIDTDRIGLRGRGGRLEFLVMARESEL